MPTDFRTPDPDFRRVVTESFARQELMTTLGATVTLVEPGAVDVEVGHDPRLTQQNGFLHAGVLAAVADSAAGYAALTLAPPGTDVLAVEFRISLLRPASAPRFVARGRVLKAGRVLSYCGAEVSARGGESEDALVASLASTIILRPQD